MELAVSIVSVCGMFIPVILMLIHMFRMLRKSVKSVVATEKGIRNKLKNMAQARTDATYARRERLHKFIMAGGIAYPDKSFPKNYFDLAKIERHYHVAHYLNLFDPEELKEIAAATDKLMSTYKRPVREEEEGEEGEE